MAIGIPNDDPSATPAPPPDQSASLFEASGPGWAIIVRLAEGLSASTASYLDQRIAQQFTATLQIAMNILNIERHHASTLVAMVPPTGQHDA